MTMAFNISETETFTKHSGDEKNYTLLVIFGLIVPIAIILVIVCIAMACRKHRNALPYSVAVTNSLLKVIHSNFDSMIHCYGRTISNLPLLMYFT